MSYSRKQPETLLKERVKKDLNTLNFCWHVKIQQVAIRGTPDILASVGGTCVALELKKGKEEEPEPLQKLVLTKIKKSGGLAYVVHPENWEHIFQFLKILDEEHALKNRL